MPHRWPYTFILLFMLWLALVAGASLFGAMFYIDRGVFGLFSQSWRTLPGIDDPPGVYPWQGSLWTTHDFEGVGRSRLAATLSYHPPSSELIESGWLQRNGLCLRRFPWSYVWTHRDTRHLPLLTYLQEDMYGWPARMIGWRSFGAPTPTAPGVIRLPPPGTPGYPDGRSTFFIWWPGIVINLLLGPVFILLGMWALTLYRGWRANHRVMQGLCSRCGHSRAGIDHRSVCPECGAAQGSIV